MLSSSESRVYPFQRVGEVEWKCDFCEAKNSTVQRFRFDVETAEQSCRELFVCSESECNNYFDSSVQFFNKHEGRVPLQQLLRTVPQFFELSFTIRRSNGDLDEGWKLPGTWNSNYEFNTLQKLRGEPWWRVVIQKDEKVRHTFLHELRELNAESLGDEWDLLFSLLPPGPKEPTEQFLNFYDASVWTLSNPNDQQLVEARHYSQ
jgi:hypothetical protein